MWTVVSEPAWARPSCSESESHFNNIPVIHPVIKGRASLPPTWSCNDFINAVIWEYAGEKRKDKPTNPVPTTYSFAFGSISAYGSSICCWKKRRFFSALILPCVHQDTKKVKQGRHWREKPKRGKGSGKGMRKMMPPPHSSAAEPGPTQEPFLGSSMSLSKGIGHMYLPSTWPLLHIPHKLYLLVPDLSLSLSLSPVWFFLPLSLKGKSYMGHVTAYMHPYFDFLELSSGLSCLAGSSPLTHISWHSILLQNTIETFYSHSWPWLVHTTIPQIWTLSFVSPFHVQALKLCVYLVKLSLLSSY